MNLPPVLALLGVTILLPCVPALNCHQGTIEGVRNASELPLVWKTEENICEAGEGCQDLVVLLKNGPQISLLISKSCTKAEDQEPRVTWLRTGPGLSMVSYTHVCRQSDYCNDAFSTEVLGDLPTPTVPGTLRCPLCLSKDDCENAPQQVCPAAASHCYNGVLRLRGGDVTTNLRVQGCMPQPDCNLLNGTQAIGSLDISENCGLQLGPQAMDCNSVALDIVRNVSDLHLRWTTGWRTCEAGQGCQETLMLIQTGQEFHMVLSKGCTNDADSEARITRHRRGPGVSIVTYTHVCRHKDFCNDLSTTRNIWTPPPDAVPGTLSCPHCLSTASACEDAPQQVCPAGTSHCYSGVLRLRGGGITTNLRLQGCVPQAGCDLFEGIKEIGAIEVTEHCGPLSGVRALECRSGYIEGLRKVSSLPLDWTTHWQTCEIGEGCQETILFVVNGPVVHLMLTKGCTKKKDHKPQITLHRTGPGLYISSYTHVCRHWDFCNDLSTTRPLWVPPPITGPGNLSCPLCLSKDNCPMTASQQVCPAGSTHCYSGVLSFRGGGGLISHLKVQGCVSQSGCDLLDGTQTIGSIDVREDCGTNQVAADVRKCQHGTLEITRDVSSLPLQWTAGETTCGNGEGCGDTLIMIENGDKVNLVLTKGCTSAEDQEAKVTEHRTGPGLSVTSYTRVCRLKDLCNDLSTTVPVWTPPLTSVPGTTRCPFCFSTYACEDSPEQVCPADSPHCYSGVLRLRGGEISSNLRVKGCMSQPGCNLLNGTQRIGPMALREECGSQTSTLTCHKGIMLRFGRKLAEEAVEWTAPGTVVCEPKELCQETLLLIHVGTQTFLLGSKGCIRPGAEANAGISIYSQPPGILVASYARFCSADLCNEARSSSVLLSKLPRLTVPPPGDLQCRVCMQFGVCFGNTEVVTCPQGTTHCYDGGFEFQGGGVSATVGIQGCMSSPGKTLLGGSKTIGVFSAKELSEEEDKDSKPLDGGASTPPFAWVLGLGLFLTLCLEGCMLSAEAIALGS